MQTLYKRARARCVISRRKYRGQANLRERALADARKSDATILYALRDAPAIRDLYSMIIRPLLGKIVSYLRGWEKSHERDVATDAVRSFPVRERIVDSHTYIFTNA